ncbi:MAG: sigma-70 family RNA polymerase sigma factor [Planctomycetota bacterium]
MPLTDEQLFDRFRRTGDRDALAAAFERSAPTLAQLAVSMVPPAEVDDVVQSTYITAIEKRQAFNPNHSLVAWLLGILRLHALEARRRDLRAREIPAGARTTEPDPCSPEDAAAHAEIRGIVLSSIARLAAPYREVVRLRVEDQLDTAEIAARLGRTTSTVRTQLSRGLKQLRAHLPKGVAMGAAAAALLQNTTNAAQRIARSAGPTPPHGPLRLVAGIGAALCVATAARLAWPAAAAAEPAAPVVQRGDAAVGPRPKPPGPTRRAAVPVAAAPARVRIVDGTGTGVANVSLRLIHRHRDQQPIQRSYELGQIESVMTDAAGFISVSHFDPAEQLAIAFDDGRSLSKPFQLVAGTVHTIRAAPALTVTVRVHNADGDPVEGAQVWLTSNAVALPGIAAGATDVQGEAAARVTDWRTPMRVWVEADGYQVPAAHKVVQEQGRTDLAFTLSPSSRVLRGRVLDVRGAPVAGAAIKLADEWRLPVRTRRTDAAGSFTLGGLGAGPYQLAVQAPGCAAEARTIHTNQLARQVDVFVEPGTTLSGVVLEADGSAARGLVVVHPAVSVAGRALLGVLHQSTPIGPDGHYALPGLPRGPLVASIRRGGEAALVETLAASSGERRWSPVLGTMTDIAGTVIDATGQPVPDAKVQLLADARYGFPAALTARRCTTDAAGHFRFAGVRDDEYRLATLPHDSSTPRSLRRVRAGQRHLRIPWQDERQCRVQLRARQPNGEPADGATLRLLHLDADAASDHKLDRNGHALVEQLLPGPYELLVQHSTGMFAAGDLELTAATPITLDDVMLRPPAWAHFELQPAAGFVGPPPPVRLTTPRAAVINFGVGKEKVPGGWRLGPVPAGRYDWRVGGVSCALRTGTVELAPGETRRLAIAVEPTIATVFRLDVDHAYNWGRFASLHLEIFDANGASVHATRIQVRENPVRSAVALPPGAYTAVAHTNFEGNGTTTFVVPDGAKAPQVELAVR